MKNKIQKKAVKVLGVKRTKQAVATIIGSLVVISSLPIFASANFSDYGYELDLTCSSTHYFDDEEDTTTYFYAETDYEGESITLVNADDLTEYTMLDDGKFSVSGDDLPYDGVYSAKIELDTSGATYENPKVLSFYALTEDGIRSDLISIEIIKRITTLQISEMTSVDKMINILVESENYTSASFEEKTSMVYELLISLAEHGTEEYPYSLIFPDSINFTGKMYEFKYSCGALGGVSITDPFQTTEPTGVGGTTTETTVTTTPIVTTDVIGDVNLDGEIGISDVVMLQKWLVKSGDLTCWQNADLCEDGVINVFDCVMLKRKVIENMQSYPVENPEVIDEFIPCTATLDDDFDDWMILVEIKHQYSVPERVWTIEDFTSIENIKSIHQYETSSPYRQYLTIGLSEQSKEYVLKLIHDIEALNLAEIKEIKTVKHGLGGLPEDEFNEDEFNKFFENSTEI